MNHKWTGIGCIILLAASLAAAERDGGGAHRRNDDMRDKMKAELNLTKEQQKKLDTHRIEQRAAMEKAMLDIKEKRDELKAALEQPKLNRIALQKINDELKDAQNEMADQRLEGILYVREVLTPDQFKKFLSLAPEMKEHRRKEWAEQRGRDKHGRSDKKGRSNDNPDDEDHESDDESPRR
ncbi:MAG: periplasmic heavy metal sensor [Elusimicrobia bacterium]|nr:periplasmic heavy metal sensor [Elusimicrobiota bacterium]